MAGAQEREQQCSALHAVQAAHARLVTAHDMYTAATANTADSAPGTAITATHVGISGRALATTYLRLFPAGAAQETLLEALVRVNALLTSSEARALHRLRRLGNEAAHPPPLGQGREDTLQVTAKMGEARRAADVLLTAAQRRVGAAETESSLRTAAQFQRHDDTGRRAAGSHPQAEPLGPADTRPRRRDVRDGGRETQATDDDDACRRRAAEREGAREVRAQNDNASQRRETAREGSGETRAAERAAPVRQAHGATRAPLDDIIDYTRDFVVPAAICLGLAIVLALVLRKLAEDGA